MENLNLKDTLPVVFLYVIFLIVPFSSTSTTLYTLLDESKYEIFLTFPFSTSIKFILLLSLSNKYTMENLHLNLKTKKEIQVQL